MLITPAVNAAINEQIGNEFAASLQYVALAAHFDGESLPELAAHFYRQADEERQHAMRFVKYVVDTGGKVEIPALGQPQARFDSAEEAVKRALDGEMMVTNQINALVDLAMRDNDHLTQNMLQWFVTEQLEEVSSAETLLKMVHRAGESGLLHIEEFLARRKPASPVSGAGGGSD